MLPHTAIWCSVCIDIFELKLLKKGIINKILLCCSYDIVHINLLNCIYKSYSALIFSTVFFFSRSLLSSSCFGLFCHLYGDFDCLPQGTNTNPKPQRTHRRGKENVPFGVFADVCANRIGARCRYQFRLGFYFILCAVYVCFLTYFSLVYFASASSLSWISLVAIDVPSSFYELFYQFWPSCRHVRKMAGVGARLLYMLCRCIVNWARLEHTINV